MTSFPFTSLSLKNLLGMTTTGVLIEQCFLLHSFSVPFGVLTFSRPDSLSLRF